MTGTRFVNRLTLGVLGLVLLAIATVAGWPVVAGGPSPILGWADDLIARTGLDRVALAWILAGVLAVAVVVAGALAATRAPRRVRAAVEQEGISLDGTLIGDVVSSELNASPDVVNVSTSVARRHRERVVHVRVQVRPRPDLADLTQRVAVAVEVADTRLGITVPYVVRVGGGFRAAFAHERRVD